MKILNFKYAEALAMALILLSWALDSRSVKYWNEAISSLNTTNQSIIVSGGLVESLGEIKLQSAITRRHNDLRLKPNNFTYEEILQKTWQYQEVRERWLQSTLGIYKALSTMAMNFKMLNSIYGLGLEEDIEFIESALMRVSNVITPKNTEENMILDREDSYALAVRVSDIIPTIGGKIKYVYGSSLEKIYSRLHRSSSIYFWLFVIGSIMLVLTKVIESKNKKS